MYIYIYIYIYRYNTKMRSVTSEQTLPNVCFPSHFPTAKTVVVITLLTQCLLMQVLACYCILIKIELTD